MEDRQSSCSEKISTSRSFSYFYIGNIPSQYHSVDLRAYFSQYIEKGAFRCFHFKHRPENISPSSPDDYLGLNESNDGQTFKIIENTSRSSSRSKNVVSDNGSVRLRTETVCSLVQIHDENISEIVTKCIESPWYNKDGKLLDQASKPHIFKMRVALNKPGLNTGSDYQTRKSRKPKEIDFHQIIPEVDLLNLTEMHPPPAMPSGNVGTSTKVLMEFIRNCKLPSSVIHKLGLKFSKNNSKRLYGSIPYCYGTQDQETQGQGTEEEDDDQTERLSDEDGVSREEDFGEEHEAEDWERHETLNDDLSLSRAKERLFEEDIELKWEKGGSGLVFYTDAYYWHEMKGKDFDAHTTDDWDVDTSAYYGHGGDRAARDLLEMRESEAIREGRLSNETKPKKNCERNGKNISKRQSWAKGTLPNKKKPWTEQFGKKVLEKQGWVKGTGLGAQRSGIAEPIEADGQSSRDKRGLGYIGEKLNRNVKAAKRRAENDVYIATVYDDHDKLDSKWRTPDQLEIKYRPPRVEFSSAINSFEKMTPSESSK